MKRLIRKLGRGLSFALIPASMVPLVLIAPSVVSSHENLERSKQGSAWPTPLVELTPKQKARFQPVAATKGSVPVLAYRGISEGRPEDPRDVSQRVFAEQMAALRHMGFRSISIDQYLKFRAGEDADLPERPVLITFDDARLDSFRGADKVLQRYAMRATMFALTGPIADRDPDYLRWSELHDMAESGRWDIQPGAHEGGRNIAVDALGTMGPFYANLRYTRSEGRETPAEFEKRVTLDVFAAKEELERQGFESGAFAVPSGDRPLPPFVSELLRRQFAVFFVLDERNQGGYTTPFSRAVRFGVNSTITTDRLYMWLRDNAPVKEAR